MASVADCIDAMCTFVSQKNALKGSVGSSWIDMSRVDVLIKIAYALGAVVWCVILGVFADIDFSSVLTVGAFLQSMGFIILCVKVRATKSVTGLSASTLSMFFVFYCFRLTSTTLKDGYIPADSTGDFLLQTFEGIALGCLVYLLYSVHKTYVHTYQEEHDSCESKGLLVPCVVLAFFVHGDFNRSPLFDMIWAASLNMETLALIPQLWMLSSIGGQVDRATSHFIACEVMACVCRLIFWWYAHEEQEWRVAALHILICHIIQLILYADFSYYYVKAFFNGTRMSLPIDLNDAGRK